MGPNGIVSYRRWLEASLTIGGRIVSIFLVIGTTKFLTSFLSEADFGTLALYTVCSTLPAMFYFGPLGQGIVRYMAVARERGEFAQFHSEYRSFFLSGSLIVVAIASLAIVACTFLGLRDWSVAIAILSALSISASFNTYCTGLQNAARKRFTALGLETGERVLQQAFAVLLLWKVSRDPRMVFVGQLVASLFFVQLNRVYYRRTFPEILGAQQANSIPLFSIRGAYQRDILRYTWPFVIFGAAFWIQSSSERWALEAYQSTEVVARYAVLNQLGFQSLSLVFGSISYFLSPILFGRAGDLQKGQFESANRLNDMFLLFNVVLTAGMALCFWILDVHIVRWLTSSQYLPIAKYLPLMVIAGGLFNFAQIYANRFMVALFSDRLIVPKLVSSGVGLALNILAARSRSIEGMIAAVILTNAVYIAVQVIAWRALSRSGLTRLRDTE